MYSNLSNISVNDWVKKSVAFIKINVSHDIKRLYEGLKILKLREPEIDQFIESNGYASFEQDLIKFYVVRSPESKNIDMKSILILANSFGPYGFDNNPERRISELFAEYLPKSFQEYFIPPMRPSDTTLGVSSDYFPQNFPESYWSAVDILLLEALKKNIDGHHTLRNISKKLLTQEQNQITEGLKKENFDIDNYLLGQLCPQFSELSNDQKNIMKIIYFNVGTHDDGASDLQYMIFSRARLQDPTMFLKFVKEEQKRNRHKTLGRILNNLSQSLFEMNTGPAVPLKYLNTINLDLDDPEVKTELIKEQSELLSKLSGKKFRLQRVISKNYQRSNTLHDVIERVTRQKLGTPEHDELFDMLLVSPNLITVKPSNYKDMIDLINRYAGQTLNIFNNEDNHKNQWFGETEDVDNIAKILTWFKDDWHKALTIFGKKEGTDDLHSVIHQLGNVLPDKTRESPKNLNMYFMRWSQRGNFSSLLDVLKLWNDVKPEDLNTEPSELMMNLLKKSKSFHAVHPEFLSETLKHHGKDLDPKDYQDWEEEFLESQAVPLPKWTEKILVTELSSNGKKYTGRFLPRSDVRGLHLGEHTNCCQHPDGVGEPCAFHGQCSPFGAFFVVEDPERNILAQSWVWEAQAQKGELAVTFDNIETRGLQGKERLVINIYEKAAEMMGAKDIHIGEGYTKIDISHLPDAGTPNGHGVNGWVGVDDDDDDVERDPMDDFVPVVHKKEPDHKYWDGVDGWERQPGLLAPKDYGDYSDAEENQKILKNNGVVNKLPEDKIFTNEEKSLPVQKVRPEWMLENPYSNVKKSLVFVWLSKIADSRGLYRLADDLIGRANYKL